MTNQEYQKKVAVNMIRKFTAEFKEKTGLKAMVHIINFEDTVDDDNVIKSMLTLQKVEKIFLMSLPSDMAEGVRLRSRCRKRHEVDIRTMFCSIAYRLNFTLADIGRHIDRDHTSIIHLTRKADDLLDTDERFASLYNSITHKMSQYYDKDI